MILTRRHPPLAQRLGILILDTIARYANGLSQTLLSN